MNWVIRGDKEPDKNKQLHILSVKEYEELSEKLTKYKRAFEILKHLFKIENYNFNDEIKKIKYSKSFIHTDLRDTEIEQEEYELLEELM